jgi:hypothetical protein
MWFVVARKRLPTPFATRATKLSPTVIVLPVLTFFNDLKADAADDRIPAAQYFGARGFFADYNARLDDPVSDAVLSLWREGFEKLQQGTLDPGDLVRRIHQADSAPASPNAPRRGDVLRGFAWQPGK